MLGYITALFLLGGSLGGCLDGVEKRAPEPPPTPSGRLQIHPDGTATALGVVITNEQHCVVDAQCWLVLDVGGITARVVYVEGEEIPTRNDAAADRGFAARPGDLLEVHGAFEGSAASPLISTCESEEYFIRPAAANPG